MSEKTEKEIVESTNFVVFGDAIGRNLIGELVDESSTQLTVKNPVVVVEQMNPQNNQKSIGFVEAFYPQLLEAGTRASWKFNRNSVTIIDATLGYEAKRLYCLITGKVALPNQQQPTPEGDEGKVVNLFDE